MARFHKHLSWRYTISGSFFLLFSLYFSPLQAQPERKPTSLGLRIIHAQTQQPLADAIVKLEGHMQVFEANEQGYCEIPMKFLPHSGSLSLEVYHPGCSPQYFLLPQSRINHEVQISLLPFQVPFTIKGQVVSHKEEAMEFVTVVLWQGNSAIAGTQTDEKGEFTLTPLSPDLWNKDFLQKVVLEARYLWGGERVSLSGYRGDSVRIKLSNAKHEQLGCVFEDPNPLIYTSTGLTITRTSLTDNWQVSLW